MPPAASRPCISLLAGAHQSCWADMSGPLERYRPGYTAPSERFRESIRHALAKSRSDRVISRHPGRHRTLGHRFLQRRSHSVAEPDAVHAPDRGGYAGMSMSVVFLIGVVTLLFARDTRDQPLPE